MNSTKAVSHNPCSTRLPAREADLLNLVAKTLQHILNDTLDLASSIPAEKIAHVRFSTDSERNLWFMEIEKKGKRSELRVGFQAAIRKRKYREFFLV